MHKVITKLEQLISNNSLTIVEKKEDVLGYIITVKHPKGFFTIYTTDMNIACDGETPFRMYQVSEHVPFSITQPYPDGRFITPYSYALKKSGKVIRMYNSGYSAKKICDLMNHAG